MTTLDRVLFRLYHITRLLDARRKDSMKSSRVQQAEEEVAYRVSAVAFLMVTLLVLIALAMGGK